MVPEFLSRMMHPQLDEQPHDIHIQPPVKIWGTELLPDARCKIILHMIQRLLVLFWVSGFVGEVWVSNVVGRVVTAGVALDAVDDFTPFLLAEQLGLRSHDLDHASRSFIRNGPRVVRNFI